MLDRLLKADDVWVKSLARASKPILPEVLRSDVEPLRNGSHQSVAWLTLSCRGLSQRLVRNADKCSNLRPVRAAVLALKRGIFENELE
jgi:hypothetical protein